MQITNNYDLPQAVVDGVKRINSRYEPAGDISVTGLIQPPRIRQLTIRHWDEIVVDITDLLYMVYGTIAHDIFEAGAPDTAVAEERLSMQCNDWEVTGKSDLADFTHMSGGVLDDYKFTSVWSYIFGREEWEEQLNLYALLWEENGFKINELRIVALFRDWMRSRAERDDSYPQQGAMVMPITHWVNSRQIFFLKDRVMAHQAAQGMPDNKLPPCTDDERWIRSDWALYKRTKSGQWSKRAAKVEDTKELMLSYCDLASINLESDQYRIEHRPGEPTRCLHYCKVNQFCNIHQEYLREAESG
jgi:hypothetical protein